ncbi:MAG: phospho-N-acetylmuramoyl-pentapeptide-transferase [Anaerolineae bacterium]|nr:phospho-N-acetylmuramoyl-pentapeptide-transferase [Anaerolineae bacterium]
MVSFIIAVSWGGPFIGLLHRHGVGKQIRADGPQTHLPKAGTPTMGGLLVVAVVLGVTTVLNFLNLIGMNAIGRSILLPMGVMAGMAVLGGVDDWTNVKRKNPGGIGLFARHKALWQLAIALVAAIGLHFFLELESVAIPGVPEKVGIGLWYLPIAVFIIFATCNTVNLTDGLDGLAAGTVLVAFFSYAVIAYLQEQVYLVAFCLTVVGALLGFLWYNAYPAQVIMGDTGALALGGTLATVALMTGQWLLLPVVGVVFVAEGLSDILQVAYFKRTKGKRLFRMAPIHHHFELGGWSEVQVTLRFWIVGILGGMLGVALALI